MKTKCNNCKTPIEFQESDIWRGENLAEMDVAAVTCGNCGHGTAAFKNYADDQKWLHQHENEASSFNWSILFWLLLAFAGVVLLACLFMVSIGLFV